MNYGKMWFVVSGLGVAFAFGILSEGTAHAQNGNDDMFNPFAQGSDDDDGASVTSGGQPTAAPSEPVPMPRFEIAIKAGGHFSQLTSDLGTSFDGILKLGVGVAMQGRLQVFADVGYSQPVHEIETRDARVGIPNSTFTATTTIRDLSTTLGGQYFLSRSNWKWVPYGGAGLRVHFLQSVVEGGIQQTDMPEIPFAKYEETSTQFGGVAFGGLGRYLGPGLALVEVRFDFTPVSQRVTGDGNVGATSVLLGYSLMF